MYNYDSELPAKYIDNMAFACYYSKLRNLACTEYEWTGLPKTVSPRFLEECLYLYGNAVIFRNEKNGFLMGMQAAKEGVNVYGNPTRVQPISPAENFPWYDFDDCAYIRANPDEFPTLYTTLRYTEQLYDIDLTRDINIKAQKTPVLILTTMKQKQSAQAVYQKYIGNAPVIYGSKDDLDKDAFTVLRTDAPFVAPQLQDLKTTIYNEYLTFLGIGVPEFKKERSITNEVDQYTKQSNAFANIGLQMRKQACEKINTLFADILDEEVDVKVSSNVDIGDTRGQTSGYTVGYHNMNYEGVSKESEN